MLGAVAARAAQPSAAAAAVRSPALLMDAVAGSRSPYATGTVRLKHSCRLFTNFIIIILSLRFSLLRMLRTDSSRCT